MQMVTPLDPEWDGIAQRPEHQVRPRPQRNHNFTRNDGAATAGTPPAAGPWRECPGVAHHRAPALALEKCRISFDEFARIRHETGSRPVNGAGKISGQTRLARRDGVAVQNLGFDP